MSPQKDTMITRQVLEQHMKDKNNLWTLESLTRTSKTGSLSASTATNMDIWQKSANQRKNKKPGSVSNTRKKDI